MSFFAQLLERVADEENHPLSSCLLQAKVLASKLRSPKFRQWVDTELEGYANLEQVPDYRMIRSPLYGDFAGPFHSEVRNVRLSIDGLPPDMRELIEIVPFTGNIGQLEALFNANTEMLYHPWDVEVVELLRHSPGVRIEGKVLNSATSLIPKAAIRGILHAIRKRLLDFLIELSEAYPDLEKSEQAVAMVSPEASARIFERVVLNISAGRDLKVGRDFAVAEEIRDSFKTADTQLPTPIRNQFQELKGAVSELCKHLAPNRVGDAAQDFDVLAAEAVKPSPRKRWLETAGEGLKETARTADGHGAKVIDLVDRLMTQLAG